jgi:hypothetical protein
VAEEAAVVIPLYGFLQGDTIGLLVLADPDERVADVAARLAASARLRAAIEGPVAVVYRGEEIDPRQTVAEAGFAPLGRFDVRRRGAHDEPPRGG